MNFIFFITNKKNYNKSIAQNISFHNELNIENPMSEDRGRGECFFERIESIMTGGVELPRNVILDWACQWNDNVQVVKDEPVIKICEI